MANHVRMKFSTNMLKSVRDKRLPWVVPCVVGKDGPWNPLCLGTTCWCSHKVSKSPHMQGTALYLSKVRMRRSLPMVLYTLLRYRNTRKRGLWYMMARSCASFSSIIAVPVPIPSRNPCRTSWNWRLASRQVSMSVYTTFQRVSSSPMPWVSVLHLGMMTKTLHPNSCKISPVRHMCWKMSTRHIQRSFRGGVFEFSLGYTSCSHCFKRSARRWVCPPYLRGSMQQTTASNYASDGVASFTWTGYTCVARGKPGVCGSSLW